MKKIIFIYIISIQILNAQENTFGVSLNPIRFIVNTYESQSYSGTLSYFNTLNHVEIAMPIVYVNDKDTMSEYDGYIPSEKVITIDLQYKKYITKKRDLTGLFFGVFTRYNYIKGKARKSSFFIASQHKFGIGLLGGVQTKVISIENLDLYWGLNLSLGIYLNKENNVFDLSSSTPSNIGVYYDDQQYIIDLELLKFSIRF